MQQALQANQQAHATNSAVIAEAAAEAYPIAESARHTVATADREATRAKAGFETNVDDPAGIAKDVTKEVADVLRFGERPGSCSRKIFATVREAATCAPATAVAGA